MTLAELAATAGALCYGLVAILFFVLHIVDRERSIIGHAVSDYGVGRASRLFVVYGAIGSLGAFSLAAATALTNASAYPLRVPLYLAALALLRIGVLRFRTNLEGETATPEGRLHYVFAVLTFALTYMVVAAAGPATDAIASSGVSELLDALAWIAAAGLAAVLVTLLPPLRQLFGLAERVFLLSTVLWLLCLSLILAQPD